MNEDQVFKSFDQDFDGEVSKEDMRKSLQDFLKLKHQEISDLKLDRLFKLVSQDKSKSLKF